MQGAAGVAGVIKMVDAMNHGVLPKSLHIDSPTTEVDWSEGAVELLTEPVPWPDTGRPRRAGVSSFGVSGTNAHLVLEQPRIVARPAARGTEQPDVEEPATPLPVVLSARGTAGLRAQADRLADFIESRPDLALVDLARSLVQTRATLSHRSVVVATSRADLLSGLTRLGQGVPSPGTVTGAVSADRRSGLGMVFSGQGSQFAGMGQELHATFPVFAKAFDDACSLLDGHLDRHTGIALREVVFAAPDSEEAALLDTTIFTQPGLFAVETALFRLLESWGLRPDVVLGHSIGEVVAAHVAGALSLEDACALVAVRARLMQGLPSGDAMLAVAASETDVASLLRPHMTRVSIAAVNAPTSVVLSGEEDIILSLAGECAQRGWRNHRLRVSHAFHSPRLDAITAELAAATRALDIRRPTIPLVSNLTGALADETVLGDPEYWSRHARETVRFVDGVRCLREQGAGAMIEVGPGGALSGLVADCVAQLGIEPGGGPLVLARGLAKRDEAAGLLFGVGELFVHGVPMDWSAVLGGTDRPVTLPTYPFQHERYWASPVERAGDAAGMGLVGITHPMLSAVLPNRGGALFTGRLTLRDQPWLAGSAVAGAVLLPNSALVEMTIRAGDTVGCPVLEELMVELPVVIPERGLNIQIAIGDEDDRGARSVEVCSTVPGDGAPTEVTVHACATLIPTGERNQPVPGEQLVGDVALDESRHAEAHEFGLHPLLCERALAVALAGGPESNGQVLVPTRWRTVRLHASGATALRVRAGYPAAQTVSLLAEDRSGQPVLTAESVEFRPIPAAAVTVDATPALFEALPTRPLARDASESMASRLAGQPATEQQRELLDLVVTHAAEVLGYTDGAGPEVRTAFKDLGFDSLAAVQLRNRLAAATGLELPATLLFDHPTPAAVAAALRLIMFETDTSALRQVDRLETELLGMQPGDRSRVEVTRRLEQLLARMTDRPSTTTPDAASRIRSATTAEVLDFIDNELGRVPRESHPG
jgi:rifamycin polyketide synthase module 1/2/3